MSQPEPQHVAEARVAPMQPVDLLRDRQAVRQEVFAKSRRLLLISAVVFLASSAVIVPMQITAAAKRRETARVSNELTVAAANRENAAKRASLVAANEELMAKRGEEARETRLWRNLLADLTGRVGPRTWLTQLNARRESGEASVEINGTAQSLRDATRFARILKASPFFEQAKLASTQSTGDQETEGVTHFECDAVLSERAIKGAACDAPLRFSSGPDDQEGRG